MNQIKVVKIGIVGHGFVGKATDWGFNKNVNKFIVDPIYKTDTSDLVKFNPEFIFVCVPTPMGNKGDQDSSIIENVIKELTDKCKGSIIIIKSTVLPSILKELKKINESIIYNPEFLREKHANEDFENSKMIILGGKNKISSKVSKLYLNHSRCKTKEHIFMDITTASLIKYSINTFLASKVIFFNEIHEIFKSLGTNDNWESFIKALSNDKRIGSSHMNVPGHDGKEGFGGACFPKDTTAFLRYSESIGIELDVLKSVLKKNNEIRSQYDDLDDREKEQNVSFSDKI